MPPRRNALDELRKLTHHPEVGEAAQVAIYCVQHRGADPRTLLAVIEAAQHGWDLPTKAERDRQRYLHRALPDPEGSHPSPKVPTHPPSGTASEDYANPPHEDPSAHGPERDPREFR